MVDIAGLESASDDVSVPADIERAMQSRAAAAIASADVVLHLHAADDAQPPLLLDRTADLFVRTKHDLRSAMPSDDGVFISAQTGHGMDKLRERLDAVCFTARERPTLTLNARHHAHLHDAGAALGRATDANRMEAGPEVIAVELRDALDALGAIVGTVSPDELLGRVFRSSVLGSRATEWHGVQSVFCRLAVARRGTLRGKCVPCGTAAKRAKGELIVSRNYPHPRFCLPSVAATPASPGGTPLSSITTGNRRCASRRRRRRGYRKDL
jgi:hypothetical protein